RITLDDGAGLIAIKAGHEDVTEDQVGLVVAQLGERVETVLGQNDLVAALLQEDLRAAAYRITVIDDQHLGGAGSDALGNLYVQAFISSVPSGGPAPFVVSCPLTQ